MDQNQLMVCIRIVYGLCRVGRVGLIRLYSIKGITKLLPFLFCSIFGERERKNE